MSEDLAIELEVKGSPVLSHHILMNRTFQNKILGLCGLG